MSDFEVVPTGTLKELQRMRRAYVELAGKAMKLVARNLYGIDLAAGPDETVKYQSGEFAGK